jgi:hypothetical protein
MIFQSFSTTTPIEGGGGGAVPITVAGLRVVLVMLLLQRPIYVMKHWL